MKMLEFSWYSWSLLPIFFFKSKLLIRSHKLPRSQETVISPCCQLLMGSKGIFFFSKHPYYQISMFPHQFGCLQTPTGWPPIYISLHTTRNTHPTGEMSSVWEDCLSLPPASSDTSDESYISDLVTNWTPPGSVIGCSSSPNLETIYSYHLQTMWMSHELPHEEILSSRSTGFSCTGAFAHMELGVPHPAEPHC